MKLGITKVEFKEGLPMFIYGVLRYISGLLIGVGLGIFLTMRYIPEADLKLLPSNLDVAAWACFIISVFISSFGWQRRSKQHLTDAKHVA